MKRLLTISILSLLLLVGCSDKDLIESKDKEIQSLKETIQELESNILSLEETVSTLNEEIISKSMENQSVVKDYRSVLYPMSRVEFVEFKYPYIYLLIIKKEHVYTAKSYTDVSYITRYNLESPNTEIFKSNLYFTFRAHKDNNIIAIAGYEFDIGENYLGFINTDGEYIKTFKLSEIDPKGLYDEIVLGDWKDDINLVFYLKKADKYKSLNIDINTWDITNID